MHTLPQAALAYASRGLPIFPCKPRDKAPATAHGLKDATTDVNTITGWWRGNPELNIGLITGKRSNIFVLDIDNEAELAKLEQLHSPLPPTVESITGRGGRHVYFVLPPQPIRNSAGKLAPGLDIRAEGGYVVVPPSVHETGRCYEWSVDSTDSFAFAPDWLLNAIAEPAGRIAGTPPSEWRELIKGVAVGSRDCTIAKLAGHLLRRRIDPVVVLALLQSWNATCCTPPLPEQDIVRVVNSIAGKETRRRADFGRHG